MIEFVLNSKWVNTGVSSGMVLLDFIREDKKLKGTKSACREGDCGSCTVLIGTLLGDKINYKAITACITPIANVHGKHVVSIEGLNSDKATSIQQALIDTAATQCGYCTPGIVVSLSGYAISNKVFDFESAIDAIGGNICRCTGYKSIEKAVELILKDLNSLNKSNWTVELIKNGYLPDYFADIREKLDRIKPLNGKFNSTQIVGGGTDLYVQRADHLSALTVKPVSDMPELNGIKISGNTCAIGAACKMSDLLEHEALCKRIQDFEEHLKWIASKLIRNIATVAGNIVNASPIGDLSILFLALDAKLIVINSTNRKREVKLKDFFKSYKFIDLGKDEYVKEIVIKLPEEDEYFNFEKLSKRNYLDIASVNSAILLKWDGKKLLNAQVSIGGVSPIPLYLTKTSKYLSGKSVDTKLIQSAAEILASEIAPISDVRGSAAYKRLLARQLFYAHFLKFFPGKIQLQELVQVEEV